MFQPHRCPYQSEVDNGVCEVETSLQFVFLLINVPIIYQDSLLFICKSYRVFIFVIFSMWSEMCVNFHMRPVGIKLFNTISNKFIIFYFEIEL